MNKETLEKLFVPYQQSLDMKELGFDEPCFSYFKNGQLSEILEEVTNSKLRNVNNEIDDYISALTFYQAFKWLLNIKQDLCLSFWCDGSGKCTDSSPYDNVVFDFNTELECLIKLIELVKSGSLKA